MGQVDKSDTDNAVVLLSGGQDSVTCLAVALNECKGKVYALALDYGQRHSIELEQAKKIAEVANIPFEILDLTLLSQITTNALTDSSIDIEQKSGQLPSTFVDGRNMLFLGFAATYAKQKQAYTIYTGVCETDYSGYPDCRDVFIKSMERTISLAMDCSFTLKTPLMWLDKSETVLLMKTLGKLEWYRYSHTCYEGKRPACGQCPACKLRLKGFEKAGMKDPILYQ